MLPTCTEELISAPKIRQFQPNSLPTEKVPFLSNPIPYPEYLYSSISTFLVNVTVSNFPVLDNGLCCSFYLFHKQCKCLLLFYEHM